MQWINTLSQGVKTPRWSKDTKPQIINDEDDKIFTTEKKKKNRLTTTSSRQKCMEKNQTNLSFNIVTQKKNM